MESTAENAQFQMSYSTCPCICHSFIKRNYFGETIIEVKRKMAQVNTPWKNSMGGVPLHIPYFNGSLYDALAISADKRPNAIALDFMGKSTRYRTFLQNIHTCANALWHMGIRPGDRVTIAMPNCPQALVFFYGINLLGGIANMIHPLSAETEIEFYLKQSKSVALLTLDDFYEKFYPVCKESTVKHLILASIKDALPWPKNIAYSFANTGSNPRLKNDGFTVSWQHFMSLGVQEMHSFPKGESDRVSVILYSGGTTGTTKGILLTNGNFNALGQQVAAANPMFSPGDKMLAAMPIFHGFGLGVCIHSMLMNGGRCILVPRFTAKSYGKDLVKYRCNFIAGVPTLYEALLGQSTMDGKDLSFLKGVFSGGDSLSVELKKKLDAFLAAHNAPVSVREGYGTTETVTACCLTPVHKSKEGSIGIPFPDTYIKIVKPGTEEELPYGQEGEILLAGPTVMQGYLACPEETAQTLRKHDDGLIWVYTGDLGVMDEEGFLYFKGRAKRMIVSSGYNIYPAQLENILDAHPAVQMSCVIGIPDPYKMQKVKAFVKLKQGQTPDEQMREMLFAYCRKHIAKYAMPAYIEFREDLPKTLVGKVAYKVLEEEENKNY